jgi:DNA mismatch repair protein MutS
VTTGTFLYDECTEAELVASIAAWNPRELIVPEELADHPVLTRLEIPISTLPDWRFAETETVELLQKQFGTTTLSGFGIEQPTPGVRAAGGVLYYLRDTKKAGLSHVTGLTRVVRGETMALDAATIINLELLANRQTGNRAESLLGLLDRCHTAMGRRLLKDWVVSPLLIKDKINARLDVVEHLVGDRPKLVEFGKLAAEIFDLERFLGRLGTDRVNARDLKSLAGALKVV